MDEQDTSSSSVQKARKRHVVVNKQDDNNKQRISSSTQPAKQQQSHQSNSHNHSHNHSHSHSHSIRQRMISQTKQEQREQRRIAKMTMQSQSPLQKLYLALVINALAVTFGAMIFFKPEWFFGGGSTTSYSNNNTKKKKWPPHHLAVLYPPNISPKTDLPLFFQQYAIATPQNKRTREAMQKLIGVRSILKPFQIYVTGWERERMLEKYPLDEYCGTGFLNTYQKATSSGGESNIRHGEDMLLWCLLHTYQNDGFIQWNMTLERPPISLSPHVQYSDEDTLKGLVIKRYGENRIHPSFLWLPKKRDTEKSANSNKNNNNSNNNKRTVSHFDMNSQLPSQILPWLINTAPTIDIQNYSIALEEQMYQLIEAEKDHWMILDAICDDNADADDSQQQQQQQLLLFENRGIMGRDCIGGSNACCVTYLPETTSTHQKQKQRSNRTRKKKYSSSSSSDSQD